MTFAVGVAFGVWALLALRHRRPILTVLAALACLAASPLAALFLGIGVVSVAVTDRSRVRAAAAAAAALLLGGSTMAYLFPGTGTMPFNAVDLAAPISGCVGVLVACRQSVLRIAAGMSLLGILAFYLMPGAVGQNMTRLVWIAAAPTVIGFSALSARRVAALTLVLSLWPGGDLLGQLNMSNAPSTVAAFYRPVRAEVSRELSLAGPVSVGQRVEVVDTANHWGSVYLSSLSLARGWDRQVDHADNPIFYTPNGLTAASYRAWLQQLAVGWVALPAASYDYASAREAGLVAAGLPYLSLTWASAQWRLYRVTAPSPLLTGARLVSVGPKGLTLHTAGPASVIARVRWSAYLRLRDAVTGQPVPACVTDSGGWVRIYLPRAETATLTSSFDPLSRVVGTDSDCVADVGAD